MTDQRFPVPQDSLEQGLIASAINSDAMWQELRGQVNSEDFTSQKAIYSFIEQYLVTYGRLPSSQVISSRFDWHPPLGDFHYWLEEMKRYVLARKVTETIQEAFNKVGNPQEAINIMLERLALIRSQQTNHIQAHDASALERFNKYKLRNQYLFMDNNIAGLRTGMHIIDSTGIGWMPGDLVGLYARPGVGKSWWLMWQGAISWMDGKTVLAISGEMPANQLSLRVDILMGHMLGYTMDYGMLQRGHPEVEESYRQVTSILSESQRWWTYDSSISGDRIHLGDIANFIREHEPDIVLVDGISLLQSETRGQEWEKMKDLSYGLKHLSTVHEVPILITHQAVNSARGRRREITQVDRGDDFMMPSLNDSAFGDSFVQACSDIITMCGDEESRFVNWYSIRKHRERGWAQALPARMGFAWDPGRGRINDLSEYGYQPEIVGQEARRILELSDLR